MGFLFGGGFGSRGEFNPNSDFGGFEGPTAAGIAASGPKASGGSDVGALERAKAEFDAQKLAADQRREAKAEARAEAAREAGEAARLEAQQRRRGRGPGAGRGRQDTILTGPSGVDEQATVLGSAFSGRRGKTLLGL